MRDDAVAVDAGLRREDLAACLLVLPADQVDLAGERVEAGALAEVEEAGQFRLRHVVVDAGLLEYQACWSGVQSVWSGRMASAPPAWTSSALTGARPSGS
jgi:hypothetical protein